MYAVENAPVLRAVPAGRRAAAGGGGEGQGLGDHARCRDAVQAGLQPGCAAGNGAWPANRLTSSSAITISDCFAANHTLSFPLVLVCTVHTDAELVSAQRVPEGGRAAAATERADTCGGARQPVSARHAQLHREGGRVYPGPHHHLPHRAGRGHCAGKGVGGGCKYENHHPGGTDSRSSAPLINQTFHFDRIALQ